MIIPQEPTGSADGNTPLPEDSTDLVFEACRTKLAQQFDNVRALAEKSGSIATFTGVTIGLIITAGRPVQSTALWAVAVALLVVAVLCTLGALWVYRWRADPSPSGLRDYVAKPAADTKTVLIENFVESYEANAKMAKKLLVLLKAALMSLVLGWLMVFAYLLSTV